MKSNKREDQDETLDLVDNLDRVIGFEKRSRIYKERKSNFRVINAFIVNSKGELWIPRRSSKKSLFPLRLDASVGGHVKSGETYNDALKREIMEELCINLELINYSLLGYLTPLEHKVSAHMKVYEIKLNNTPKYNPEDISESYWLSPEELLLLSQKPNNAKDDLPKLIKLFYIK